MVEGKQKAAFEKTLKELGLEYLDLYLLHWPINDVAGSWKVLENYYEQGLIKNIGVSNFNENHLKRLWSRRQNIAPAVDQIEICPVPRAERYGGLLSGTGYHRGSMGTAGERKAAWGAGNHKTGGKNIKKRRRRSSLRLASAERHRKSPEICP